MRAPIVLRLAIMVLLAIAGGLVVGGGQGGPSAEAQGCTPSLDAAPWPAPCGNRSVPSELAGGTALGTPPPHSPVRESELARERRASPTAEARGTSTTLAARGVATNPGPVHGPIKPGAVPINAQKQAGHVPGTSQYANRIKQGKPTSAWDPGFDADAYTQYAWEYGTPTPAGNERIFV